MDEVPVTKIIVSGLNPRKEFGGDAFKELVTSVKAHGVLEPLIVRSKDGGYELVAGERRLKAAKEAGLKAVPVVVKELNDAEVKEIMLIENLQREGLSPLEEAEALRDLLEDAKGPLMTQTELARRIGKSQAWIANRLRLLKAPSELKDLLISREIDHKHVLEVLPVAEYPVYKERVLPALRNVLKEEAGISVEEIRDLVDVCMRNRGDEKRAVLDIDDFPFDARDYKRYFNFKGCEDCEHVRKVKDWNKSTSRFCLNRQCWADRLNQAKNKYEKANAAALTRLDAKETVDPGKLDYDKYTRLNHVSFDRTECKACEKCKKNKNDLTELICLDPACAKRKTAAVTRLKNKRAHAEHAKAIQFLDEKLTKIKVLGEREQRYLLNCLCEEVWSKVTDRALKAYDGKTKNIPKEELPRALIQVAVFGKLERDNIYGGGVTRAKVRQALRTLIK